MFNGIINYLNNVIKNNNFKIMQNYTIKMKKLLFGTAGIPISSTGPTAVGVADVRKLGLGAMELEFV